MKMAGPKKMEVVMVYKMYGNLYGIKSGSSRIFGAFVKTERLEC